MTIEERLIHDNGFTEHPELGLWMLRDGRLVNGSYEGRQRDIDHHEIGQYFKRSKFEDLGSSRIYIKKFMRRGNLRWGCSECCYGFEYAVTPTQDQFKQITKHMVMAYRRRIDTCIGHYSNGTVKYKTFTEWCQHLARYTSLLDEYTLERILMLCEM